MKAPPPAESEPRFGAASGNETCPLELSVVMPCLNEAETIETCIRKALQTLEKAHIVGEVVVADNGSTDGSSQIAERLGARVVGVESKGYGSALKGGVAAACGKYVVMGDADGSYDFTHIPFFLTPLREGADLVMGNRFRGGIQKGAMPPLHRYLGNPVLSWIGRSFFHSPARDFHCGLRGVRKDAFERMDLRSTGMEFASEMVVKATLLKMRVVEVPTTLSPDGRSRAPHLRTWHDGWRHLRFLLLYSPRWLFLYPGIALMVMGAALGFWLLPDPKTVGNVVFDVDTLLYGAAFLLMGYQSTIFAVFTKVFAISEGLLPADPWLDKLFRYVTLEVGLLVGAALILLGLGLSFYAVGMWQVHNFGPLNYVHTMRIVIPAVACLIVGLQTEFASFFLSVLGLRRH